MNANDRPVFFEKIAGLAELQGRELSPAGLKIWWAAMKRWDLEEFIRAANYLAVAMEFMPKPAHFEKLRRSSVRDGHEAWAAAVEHARGGWRRSTIGDSLIAEAVQRLGGFSTLGQCNESQLDWKKRDFLAVYDTVLDEKIAAGALPFALPGDDKKRLEFGGNDETRARRLQQDPRPGGTDTRRRAGVSSPGARPIREFSDSLLRGADRGGRTIDG